MSGEWRTILGIGAIMIVMIAAFAVYTCVHNRRRRRNLLRRIRADWGNWPEREYDYYEWNAAEGYFSNKKTDRFQIDETTWSDLELSRVFMALNHTWSYLGEGYLFYLLHTPSFEEQELAEGERLVTYFMEHEQEREQLSQFFAELGKAGRNSVFDAIYTLADVATVKNSHHFLMMGLVIAAIIVLVTAPTPGILLLLGVMFITMMDYYKCKRPIEKYIISIRYLLRTLEEAEKLRKLPIPEIREYQERIGERVRAFGKLKRNTFFLMVGAGEDMGILTAFIIYLNIAFHIDLIQFSVIVDEIRSHLDQFEALAEDMGKLECAIAIGSFRTCMGDWCVPLLHHDGNAWLETEQLYHPMIQDPVKNSIRAQRSVLVTGSNASGKSTFLKTVAVNAILAQTVHTVLADRWEGSYFRVYSSMALQDNLEGQESYYIVEIKSLKRILDQIGDASGRRDAHRPNGDAEGEAMEADCAAPVLCFVDEVLRGTNTVERIAASSQVLRHMCGGRVLCFAATHDIELTRMLEAYYDNYHFQEEVLEKDIRFDYRLLPGRAASRNAIRLLAVMGYDETVIQRAEETAERFLESGEWEIL